VCDGDDDLPEGDVCNGVGKIPPQWTGYKFFFATQPLLKFDTRQPRQPVSGVRRLSSEDARPFFRPGGFSSSIFREFGAGGGVAARPETSITKANDQPMSLAKSDDGGKSLPLHDAIVALLRERGDGVAPQEIALRFLKLKAADPRMAALAVKAILGPDRRCRLDEEGRWHATAESPAPDESLRTIVWTACFGLTDPLKRRILYGALWELAPLPACVKASWLLDPRTLPEDEQDQLITGADGPFDPAATLAVFCACLRAGGNRLPVFLDATARSLFAAGGLIDGEELPDDTVTVRELLKAADLPRPRPLTLDTLETVVLGSAQNGVSARAQGERFATCMAELLETLRTKGIESRADLDERLKDERAPLFDGKAFSYDDLLSLPPRPGVYGFKNREGAIIYIGKAANLKRRVLSYFADTDESPQKIARLRAEAHALVTYACGSELESLLQEYRLIKKYAPPLNTKSDINERKGEFKPINDCIILLPHATPGKGMSVWFRENQKIMLKPFDADFSCASQLHSELNAFFFTPRLPTDPSDFPEQEIAVRWIKRQGDALTVVPVARMADGGEALDAMKSAWRDTRRY
jgi:hypothetical protein